MPSFGMLTRLLAHPLTRGLDIDDPATTNLRRTIIRSKPFLRKIYDEWYRKLVLSLPDAPGAVVEIGSGPGFLDKYVPRLITSDILFCDGVQVVLNGESLPFASGSLRGILMTNVLHHIPWPAAFLAEALRCVRVRGVIAMIEPWRSPWSNLIYTHLHHEPFVTDQRAWGHSANGPLSGANDALPWIIFERDRKEFEARFPDLTIVTVEPFMPFRYLLSGGVSMRTLMPSFTFGLWKELERWMEPWMKHCAMFARVVLVKTNTGAGPRASQ